MVKIYLMDAKDLDSVYLLVGVLHGLCRAVEAVIRLAIKNRYTAISLG